jgi:type II secretory pathway pseudopilin PulG
MSRRRRRAMGGLTIIEMLVTTFVFSLAMAGVLALISAASIAFDKGRTETDQGNDARLAMDEMLCQLRASGLIVASQTLGGTTFTTGSAVVTGVAPAYDPATTNVILSGVSDAIAFKYDSQAQTVSETIVAGTGSVRPNRSQRVIARNVQSLACTYRVRDQFTATASGNVNLTLSAAPQATPAVYVNGAAGTCTVSGTTATVNSPAAGADIQLVYPVTPTSATLPFVSEVDVTMNFQALDSRRIARTMTIQGGARLRNQRL